MSRTRITTALIALFSGLASAAPAAADGALAVGRSGSDSYSGYSGNVLSLAQGELGTRWQRIPDSTGQSESSRQFPGAPGRWAATRVTKHIPTRAEPRRGATYKGEART
jgi:hypothetical protein